MARKFLYFIAIMVVLVIGVMIALSIWSKEATEFTFVPRGEFVEQDPLALNAYNDPDMWYARPGLGNNPARFQPDDVPALSASPVSSDTSPARSASNPSAQRPAAEQSLNEPNAPAPTLSPTTAPATATPDGTDGADFALFFVHPTSYIPNAVIGGAGWNAKLGDQEAEDRARLFIRGLASPFGTAREIWIPKYRQAHVGAFLTDRPQAQRAIDAAYRDVSQSFDYFLGSIDSETPIVLAGHSQGALHIIELLRQKVRGTELESRIAAIYPIGWPISVDHDLPELGFPACATENQSGCIFSYVSFGQPADPSMLLQRYSDTIAYDGQQRSNSAILCVNPLTGGIGGDAPRTANNGTLVPDDTLTNATLQPGMVGARCNEEGLLLISEPPDLGNAVLPGRNFHVYDIPLFWQDLRMDVQARVANWAMDS